MNSYSGTPLRWKLLGSAIISVSTSISVMDRGFVEVRCYFRAIIIIDASVCNGNFGLTII